MASRPTYRISLQPLDPMLFGDNRLSRAGADHLTGRREPSPLVFYGAIGTRVWKTLAVLTGSWPHDLLGRNNDERLQDADISCLRGCVQADPSGALFFPKPLSIRADDSSDSCYAWRPKGPQPLSSLQQGLLPLSGAMPQREVEEPLLVNLITMRLFLGGCTGRFQLRPIKLSQTQTEEYRIGVGMQSATNTPEEGILFNRPYLRHRERIADDGKSHPWGYEAYWQPLRELTADEQGKVSGLGFLGGDCGRVRIVLKEPVDEPFRILLDHVRTNCGASQGFILYLLSPAVFPGSSPAASPSVILPSFHGHSLAGAAIGKPQYISGWNSAGNHPRRLYVAAPAGSVLFYSWNDDDDRENFIREHWLDSVSDVYASAGFGRVLIGVWNA